MKPYWPHSLRNIWRFFGIIVLAFGLASCSFSQRRQALVEQVAYGEYEQAHATLDKIEKRNPSLLDLMDRGMILHLEGRYEESNNVFDGAEKIIEELYAMSVSREASTYLVNDLTQAYSGEDFERVYVNVYKAANFINLGNFESALVEIRRIDQKLQVYLGELGGRAIFKEHAFAHYLSGLVHEAGGEYNDAYVSYRKAYQAYRDVYANQFGLSMPKSLETDLMRGSYRLGMMDHFEHYRRQFKSVGFNKESLKDKEIVFLLALGKVAHKEEDSWSLTGPGGNLMKMAFPVFVPTSYRVRWAEVDDLHNKISRRSGVVEDLSAIAAKTLDERMTYVKAKATSRMLARAGASAAAGVAVAKATDDEALGVLVGILTNMLLSEMERADTRSWLTLPDQFHMVRFWVPRGFKEMDFRLHYFDASGRKLYSEDLVISNTKGDKIFVFLRPREV